MTRSFPLAVIAFAVGTAVLAPPASAGPFDRRHPVYGDAPAAPTANPTADDWMAIGLARYEAGDFKAAIDAFVTGNTIDPRPAFLFAIAQAERRRGDCGVAIVYYARFLASSPSEAQAAAAREQRDRCEQALAAAPAEEPAPEPAPAVAEVEVVVAPASAPRRPAPRPWWKDPIVDGLGGGAIVLTVAGVALLRGAAITADAAAAATTYDEYGALRARAHTRQTTGVVALSAGLVLGAAAAVVAWKPWRRDVVVITPGPGVGVAMAGRW